MTLTTPTHTERVAAQNATQTDPGPRARQWLLETQAASLCTRCCEPELEGYPFGSVVPFALLADGRPVLQLADMAAHSRNLAADPRASLLVRQPGLDGDPQTGWRLTVMGRFVRIDDPVLREQAFARFVARVPAARRYDRVHAFDMYVMEHVERVRYIAGFGQIAWLEGASILRDPDAHGFAEGAQGAIDHMNEDHIDALLDICEGLEGTRPESVVMESLDPTGFTIRTHSPDGLVHAAFGREVTMSEVRHAVIDVLKHARAPR